MAVAECLMEMCGSSRMFYWRCVAVAECLIEMRGSSRMFNEDAWQ